LMMDEDNEYFNQFVIKLNESIIATLNEMDLVNEMKRFVEFLFSDIWLEAVEYGTTQQVVDLLGSGIDPLTNKLLGVYGPDMVVNFPIEMI